MKNKLFNLKLLLATLVLFSCAKENPYEEVFKAPELMNKNGKVDTRATYVYVPSTLGTPRSVSAAVPFFKGQAKLVKFKFAENALEIFEVEKDERFRDNPLNNTPVITIPVTYKDYRCSENSQGECSNREEENNEIHWSHKNYFIPNFASMQVNEVNTLDLFSVDKSCVVETGTNLLDYTFDKEVINIRLEKSYKFLTNYKCIAPLYYDDNMSSAGFKVQFMYSMMKLESIASSDYEPVVYPSSEHTRFGYFKSEISKLDHIYSTQETKYLLNRWNPKKKQITYFLSDTFAKEKNAIIKDATIEAFRHINKGLTMANTGLKLVLKQGKGIQAGDLRYNVINLIDEPMNGGLLGYAPMVTNPLTGEIINAHINMYGGALTKSVKWVYQMMVDLSIEKVNSNSFSNSNSSTGLVSSSILDVNNSQRLSLSLGHVLNQPPMDNFESEALLSNYSNSSDFLNSKRQMILSQAAEDMKKNPIDELEAAGIDNSYEERFKKMAEVNADPIEMINVSELAKGKMDEVLEIDGVLASDRIMVPWDALTEDQQKEVVKVILPKVYIKTFVHEMGHNLGLRHNFKGSTDKENFYTQEEAETIGIEGVPTYSSIMDYAASHLNELNYFGKYDIAALRFGYAREVEDKEGKFVKIDDTLINLLINGVQVKSYKFCTDQNAGLSAYCNRFDEGTSLTEIAQFHIKNYKTGYKYRNYRNGRTNFSTLGIEKSVSARNWMFKNIRQLYEEFEFFKTIFGEKMNQGCTAAELEQYPICSDINDRKSMMDLIAQMFLDVLKTPDLTCALASKEEPSKVIKTVRLGKEFEDTIKWTGILYVPKSCFDPGVVSHFASQEQPLVVVGQVGKYFNSIKEVDPRYKNSETDIAIRGIWHDKVLAMKYLALRYLGVGSTEEIKGSIIDNQKIVEELINVLAHISLGNPLDNPFPFVTLKGETFKIPYDLSKDYIIPELPSMGVIKFFNLPLQDNVNFTKVLFESLVKATATDDIEHEEVAKSLIRLVSVFKKDVTETFANPNIDDIYTDDAVYGAMKNNVFAHMMIESIHKEEFLINSERNEVDEVFTIRKALHDGEFNLPETFIEDQKTASKVPLALLTQLKSLKESGAPLTEEMLINQLGEELGQACMVAFNMEEDKLVELITFIEEAFKIPTDISIEKQKLYEMDYEILKNFVAGELKAKNERYQKTIEFLPVL